MIILAKVINQMNTSGPEDGDSELHHLQVRMDNNEYRVATPRRAEYIQTKLATFPSYSSIYLEIELVRICYRKAADSKRPSGNEQGQ